MAQARSAQAIEKIKNNNNNNNETKQNKTKQEQKKRLIRNLQYGQRK